MIDIVMMKVGLIFIGLIWFFAFFTIGEIKYSKECDDVFSGKHLLINSSVGYSEIGIGFIGAISFVLTAVLI